jgi:hypothetical protein
MKECGRNARFVDIACVRKVSYEMALQFAFDAK